MIFFNKKKKRKIRTIFDMKLTLKGRILQFLTMFTQLNAKSKKFLWGWLLASSIKDGPVKCAKVWGKSVVILKQL